MRPDCCSGPPPTTKQHTALYMTASNSRSCLCRPAICGLFIHCSCVKRGAFCGALRLLLDVATAGCVADQQSVSSCCRRVMCQTAPCKRIKQWLFMLHKHLGCYLLAASAITAGCMPTGGSETSRARAQVVLQVVPEPPIFAVCVSLP